MQLIELNSFYRLTVKEQLNYLLHLLKKGGIFMDNIILNPG